MELNNSITLAEAAISYLIGHGRLDETNPQILRIIQEKLEKRFGISVASFYTKVYSTDDLGFSEIHANALEAQGYDVSERSVDVVDYMLEKVLDS